MKTTVERLPDFPARVKLQVEVEAERVEQAVDRAYRRVARSLRIPGFRPGRAPRKVVEMYIGKDALWQEALEDLVPEAYREATKQAAVEPVAQAHIDIVDYGEGKPLTFTAEVDVKPEVVLGAYKGLSVEKRVRKVTDADVDEVLERLRQNQAQLVAADKTTLEKGDFAVIDYDGFIDGQPFQGGAGRGEIVEAGGGSFLPGFAEQLVGMSVGEEREITVRFPDNARQDLAGKEAKFVVRLKEIKTRVVPELDDEFAKDVGDFETLAELRADVRKRLEEAAQREADVDLEAALIRMAADNATVNIPEVMIEQEIELMKQELEFSLLRSGLRLQDYLQMNNLTEEQLKADLRPGAEQRVKNDLVLEAIGRAEGLSVSEEEVDERIRAAYGPGRNEEELKKLLADEDRRAVARENLLRLKAIRWLIDNADVTVVEYEPETPAVSAEAEEPAASTGETLAADSDEGEK